MFPRTSCPPPGWCGGELAPALLRPPRGDGGRELLRPGALPARALRPLCGHGPRRRDRARRGHPWPRGGAARCSSWRARWPMRPPATRSCARWSTPCPAVVDCDRVSVWVWDEEAGELACRGHLQRGERAARPLRCASGRRTTASSRSLLRTRPRSRCSPTASPTTPTRRATARAFGGEAAIAAPIVARGDFLGTLTVTVTSEPARLRPRRELLDRLSGVVAQAATALQTAQARGHGHAPGPPRRADRARQPDRVRGADGACAGRGGRERRAGRVVLRGPGRLQVRERRARAPRRRRAPLPRGRASARHDPLG